MTQTHTNVRLEALCDGVFAIAMTLLIIEVKLPSPERIASTPELWRALWHLAPSVFAFLLSFGVILITWVNHHAALQLVNGSSPSFIYANGFLLLIVVSIPFPTALLGEFLGTDHASPAVVLYNAVLSVQALGWVLVSGTALGNRLTTDEKATATMRRNNRNGYVAVALYAVLAFTALWLPLVVAALTTMTWLFWLMHGIRMKPAEWPTTR